MTEPPDEGLDSPASQTIIHPVESGVEMTDRDRLRAEFEAKGVEYVRSAIKEGRMVGAKAKLGEAWLAEQDAVTQSVTESVERGFASRAVNAAELQSNAALEANNIAKQANRIAIIATIMATIAIFISIYALLVGNGGKG